MTSAKVLTATPFSAGVCQAWAGLPGKSWAPTSRGHFRSNESQLFISEVSFKNSDIT